jgi:hypothetical protein
MLTGVKLLNRSLDFRHETIDLIKNISDLNSYLLKLFSFHRSFTEAFKPDKNLSAGYKLPSGFSRRVMERKQKTFG